MIYLFCVVIGVFLGWRKASRLGGDRADKLHYAGAYFIGFSVIGILATIIVHHYFAGTL